MTNPADDKQKRKQSPAEEAAEKIVSLINLETDGTAIRAHAIDTARQSFASFINEAITAERAEAAVTLERHDRMAAYIIKTASCDEYEKTEAWAKYININGLLGDNMHPRWMHEAANRHEESEK